jgi:hypothetical protein
MKTPDPTKAESSALDSVNSINSAGFMGTFPARQNTVTAEVIARLISGESLTGMDAVYCASTTRLAAVVDYLEKCYGWVIDRLDVDVDTKDGRIAVIRTYFLSRASIRRAFDAGALKFCRSVTSERAKLRAAAHEVKAEAKRRNAARLASRIDPRQMTLLGGAK